jgi:tetratricopeptide (TPR) repeat protein
LEATQAYERLGQIYFFANQALSGFYTALRGLNLAEAAAPSPALARLYANMCLGMALVPLHPLARMYIRLALNTARQIDHQPSLAWVLELSAIYHTGVGGWTVVDRSAGQATEISRRLGDRRRWEESLVLLASLAYYRGQFARSVGLWQQIYRSALQRGDAQVQQWSLCGQAESSLPLGRTEQACALLKRSLALPVEIADHSTDISCYGLLAVAEWRLGRAGAARTAAERGLQLIEEVSPTAFSSLEGYAGVAEIYGRLWAAGLAGKANGPGLKAKADRACKALAGFARIFPIAQPRAWLCRGHLAWMSNRPGRAEKAWQKSLAAANKLAMPYEAGLAHARMGRHAACDPSLLQENLGRAREIFSELGAVYELGRM